MGDTSAGRRPRRSHPHQAHRTRLAVQLRGHAVYVPRQEVRKPRGFLADDEIPRRRGRPARAKVRQNPEVQKVLLATANLVLKPDHRQEPDAPAACRYYEILTAIREDLRRAPETH